MFKDFAQTDSIATKIVDQHISQFALFADGSFVVLGASKDVDVAFAFKEMVVISTLKTVTAIFASLDTLSYI